MSAFDQARDVETAGAEYFSDFLRQQASKGQFVLTDKGSLSLMLQKTAGDALVNRDKKVWGVELKVEKKTTGNLFLEMWSNRKWCTPGWMLTNQADVLVCMFLDVMELHSIPFKSLKQWAFCGKGKKTDAGKIFDYPLKQQRVYDQLNDTWGFCVPLEVLRQEVGVTTYTRDENGVWISNVNVAA